MFIGEIESIINELIKTILFNILIADVDLTTKLRKIDIHPVRILRFVFEKSGILNHGPINRIFEGVWVTGFIK
jgi:hypothetical protein